MRADVIFGGIAVLGLAVVVSTTWSAFPTADPPLGTAPSSANGSPVAPTSASPVAPTSASPVAPTSASPVAPTIDERASVVPRAPASDLAITLDDLRAADADEPGVAILIAGLDSVDRVVAAEAADALVARKAVSALPALAAVDVAARPGSALAIIDALGHLGGLADDDRRTSAVTRLLELLRIEKRRAAPESAGNLVQIYEALGDTRDLQAAAALELELLDRTVGNAPKVVVVQALEAIRTPTSRRALLALRETLGATVDADGFEAELRADLSAALERALRQLP